MQLGLFDKYLTLWVALCIVAGIALGELWPAFPDMLSRFTYSQVSIPVALLVWFMIYPMMARIEFSSVMDVRRRPRGLALTLVINWLVKPFTMFAIAWFFLKVVFEPWISGDFGSEYIAGAILLGAAPCTAMVFVWSYLTRGDAAYTLVQVTVNDLVLLFAYAPIVILLLGIGDITVPYDTVVLSVVLYVVIPLVAGYASRAWLLRAKGEEWFDKSFLPRLGPVAIAGLLLTLVLLFSFQGETILENPGHIGLIAVPLVLQTFVVFAIAYAIAKLWGLSHDIAAPAALIGASNFFELAVAAAVSLFGLNSGAALATVVGVLVEVPVMLLLVRVVNATSQSFAHNHDGTCCPAGAALTRAMEPAD
ncbi:MAG: ACR3 family arsenite efflux transporter [Dehalococcoidia bacterium]|jgi:ACR3 family arsenite transporter|nr:ACR3 family arsenite efflux transporter [Dehalococcoidia bacterium]